MVHKWMKAETLIGYNSSSSPCEQSHNVKKDPAINATSDTLYSCEEKNFDVVVHQLPVRIVALSILADMFLKSSCNKFTQQHSSCILRLSFCRLNGATSDFYGMKLTR